MGWGLLWITRVMGIAASLILSERAQATLGEIKADAKPTRDGQLENGGRIERRKERVKEREESGCSITRVIESF